MKSYEPNLNSKNIFPASWILTTFSRPSLICERTSSTESERTAHTAHLNHSKWRLTAFHILLYAALLIMPLMVSAATAPVEFVNHSGAAVQEEQKKFTAYSS